MPAENAYPSGHLIQSTFFWLANDPIVETSFPNLLCLSRFFTWYTSRYFLDFAVKESYIKEDDIVWNLDNTKRIL